MPRPKRIRKVINPPHFKGYKPIGLPEADHTVVLNYEEYEAIRLCDHELYGQVVAAQVMEVSRPTFARIYESARRKVALAFVQGLPIVFEGGKVYFDSEWYTCKRCGCWFNHPEKDSEVTHCALCGSVKFEQFQDNGKAASFEEVCVCLKCGNEIVHAPGKPCGKEICPNCNSIMIRKGGPRQHRNRTRNY